MTFHDKQEMWLAGPILKLNAEEIEEEVYRKSILIFHLSVSTSAVIGQFCGPYSTVRPAKFESGHLTSTSFLSRAAD